VAAAPAMAAPAQTAAAAAPAPVASYQSVDDREEASVDEGMVYVVAPKVRA
jgi:hypothetical protein